MHCATLVFVVCCVACVRVLSFLISRFVCRCEELAKKMIRDGLAYMDDTDQETMQVRCSFAIAIILSIIITISMIVIIIIIIAISILIVSVSAHFISSSLSDTKNTQPTTCHMCMRARTMLVGQ